jgi:hypothetical protein
MGCGMWDGGRGRDVGYGTWNVERGMEVRENGGGRGGERAMGHASRLGRPAGRNGKLTRIPSSSTPLTSTRPGSTLPGSTPLHTSPHPPHPHA